MWCEFGRTSSPLLGSISHGLYEFFLGLEEQHLCDSSFVLWDHWLWGPWDLALCSKVFAKIKASWSRQFMKENIIWGLQFQWVGPWPSWHGGRWLWHWSSTSWDTTTRQRERRDLAGNGVGFETSKPPPPPAQWHSPSDKATPPNLSNQFHRLGTKHSNERAYGGHPHSHHHGLGT